MTAWFISDIHLKDINERSSIILLRFLRSLLAKERPATHLFLLGDIFDLWVADAPVFINKFQPIVDALYQLKQSGVNVVYFEGNHDVHIHSYWQEVLGIETLVAEKLFQLGKFSVHLEHGDLINTKDLAYLRYRKVIRHPLLAKAAPIIAGRVLNQLGNWASQLSRKGSSKRRSSDQDSLRQMIRTYAEARAEDMSFDLIVTGHMHIRDDYTFENQGKRVRSINLGSWFEEPAALCLNEKGPQFVALD